MPFWTPTDMCVDCAGDLVTLWRNVETRTGWLQVGDWGQSGEITRTGATASQAPDYAKHREQKQIGPKAAMFPQSRRAHEGEDAKG